MQGLITPGIGFTLKMLPTNIAPVLPVLANASSLLSFSSWKPMLMLLLGFAVNALVALSAKVMSFSLGMISKAEASTPAGGFSSPNSPTGLPSVAFG